MKFPGMIIACIMLIIVPLNLNSDQKLNTDIIYIDLQEHKEELKNYIGVLEKEITNKKTELDSLDVELVELERKYNGLLEENKKVSDRLNFLNAVNNY